MTDQQREYPKTPREPLPVAGYTNQTDEAIALVNENKLAEERLLRVLDRLAGREYTDPNSIADPRWLAIAKTHFQQGFMALNRAIFKPTRIALPDDKPGEEANAPL